MTKPSIKSRLLPLALSLCLATPAFAQTAESIDWDMVSRIRAEAFNRSQVSDTLKEMTEGIGPRLTNSPLQVKAQEWARTKLTKWGLVNVHDEVYEEKWGRGWEFKSASIEMLSPRQLPLYGLPRAWTPGTNGAVEGEVALASIKGKEDLDKYKGQLKGKIVLVDDSRAYKLSTKADFTRYDEAGLGELQTFPIPEDRPSGGPAAGDPRLEQFRKRNELSKVLNQFLVDEGVVATLRISPWDNGVLVVTGGGSRKAGESAGVPDLVLPLEHYNQLVRAVQAKQTVKLRINVDARFTSEADLPASNTFAELPGTGPKADEVVILGAHFDSWHTGTGASDNGAGSAVMMEAMRILKTLGVKPRRTIRLALWTGEEQGLNGSAGYVAKHFGKFPEPKDPAMKDLPRAFRVAGGPLEKTKEYDKFAAYFNFDNGTGKIRGVYAQENAAVVPIFEQWLKPFHDLDAKIVTLRNTSGTDHLSFDAIGLPGFQFVQDPTDYSTHVHHTQLDNWDHVVVEDLKQASAIIAFFAWQAAQRDEKLPHKPLPPTP